MRKCGGQALGMYLLRSKLSCLRMDRDCGDGVQMRCPVYLAVVVVVVVEVWCSRWGTATKSLPWWYRFVVRGRVSGAQSSL